MRKVLSKNGLRNIAPTEITSRNRAFGVPAAHCDAVTSTLLTNLTASFCQWLVALRTLLLGIDGVANRVQTRNADTARFKAFDAFNL